VTQRLVYGTFVNTGLWRAGGVAEDVCSARDPEIWLVAEAVRYNSRAGLLCVDACTIWFSVSVSVSGDS